MSRMRKMKSIYHCPICELHLVKKHDGDRIVLWCSNGKCESQAANQEYSGNTELVAFSNLKIAVDIEQTA